MRARRTKWCVRAIVLCALLAAFAFNNAADAQTRGQDNQAAIEAFGISRSQPIEGDGFFFFNAKYIDAPYVVERRGLDVYVNGFLVSPGPEWPPYDYSVKEDPGDPPPGSAPFHKTPAGLDRRDTYWCRKWRYLSQHYDYEAARQKMFETYKKCTEIRDVSWHEKDPADMVVLITKRGKREVMDLHVPEKGRGSSVTKEQVLLRREKKKAFYEKLLRSKMVVFRFSPGLEVGISGDRARKVLGILLSEAPEKEKIRLLERNHVHVSHGDRKLERIVTELKTTPQLAERLKQWNEAHEEEERRK